MIATASIHHTILFFALSIGRVMYTIRGHFGNTSNPEFAKFIDGGDFNVLRHIFIRVTDGDENKKVANIARTYGKKKDVHDMRLPITPGASGTYIVKFNTAKLSRTLDRRMLGMSRRDWINRYYDVVFSVKKYCEKRDGSPVDVLLFTLVELKFID